MVVGTTEFLSDHLVTVPGQPLRVAVYSRIAAAIRGEVLKLGNALPKESELGEMLGVSRTVVREALMLLEEDGLIRTRRGVGRFVADKLPHVGLEELQPLDVVLAEPDHPVEIQVIDFGLQPTTDFISNGLDLDDAANTWFREAVARRDGEPIAIIQEHLPAGRYLDDVSPLIARHLKAAADRPASLLAGLISLCGSIFSQGNCHLTCSIAGADRARLLAIKASDPVLILTLTARVAGRPAYLAKGVVTTRVGHLSVAQNNP